MTTGSSDRATLVAGRPAFLSKAEYPSYDNKTAILQTHGRQDIWR